MSLFAVRPAGGWPVFLPHVHRLDIENASARAEQAAAGAAAGKKKKASKAGEKSVKSKISREAKVIPQLIFEIEQYERHLIKLAQTTKVGIAPWRHMCVATRAHVGERGGAWGACSPGATAQAHAPLDGPRFSHPARGAHARGAPRGGRARGPGAVAGDPQGPRPMAVRRTAIVRETHVVRATRLVASPA